MSISSTLTSSALFFTGKGAPLRQAEQPAGLFFSAVPQYVGRDSIHFSGKDSLKEFVGQSPVFPSTDEAIRAAKQTNAVRTDRDGQKIAIWGGGNLGLGLFTDLILQNSKAGQGVNPSLIIPRKSNRAAAMLAPIYKHGGTALVDIADQDKTYFIPIEDEQMVPQWETQKLNRAIKGSDVVFVIVPDIAEARKPILDKLFDMDLDGKTLIFSRGGQGGIMEIADRLRVRGRNQNITIGMIEDSPYAVRSDGIVQLKRKNMVKVAVFPAEKAQTVVEQLKTVFPMKDERGNNQLSFQATGPLALILGGLSYLAHPTVALDSENLARTKRGEQYKHYVEGIDPRIADIIQKLDEERLKIARAYGLKLESWPEVRDRQHGRRNQYADYYQMFRQYADVYDKFKSAPYSELASHRYLHEDLPGALVLIRLAEIADIPVPVLRQQVAEKLETVRREFGLDPAVFQGYSEALKALPNSVEEVKAYLQNPTSHP